MKSCKDKSIDATVFSYSNRSILPSMPKRLKMADARIRDLIMNRRMTATEFLDEMQNLKTQLSSYSKRITYERKALVGTSATCDPSTRVIHGPLSQQQARWLKYFSPKTMTSEEVEAFNSWNEVEKSIEHLKIDELIETIDVASSLYSNPKIADLPEQLLGEESKYSLDYYRDRYSLSSTSVTMLALVQVKLITEDILFLLTSIIKSLYFVTSSDKMREKILDARDKVQQLILSNSPKETSAADLQEIAENSERQRPVKEYGPADRQLDKIGKELMLRYLGQLNLSLKTIKQIKLRTSESWQRTVAQAKARNIANAQMQKKAGSSNWRTKLRLDMVSQMKTLPDPHVFDITDMKGAMDRYNELLSQIEQLEYAIRKDVIKGLEAEIGRNAPRPTIERKELSEKNKGEFKPQNHIPDWKNW